MLIQRISTVSRFVPQALVGALLATLSGCLAEDSVPDGTEDTASVQDRIINGTVPARGALQGFGVVRLDRNGDVCTGTLVTNQHVLTAHHCVRTYTKGNTPPWAATVAGAGTITATVEGTTANSQSTNSSILEPSGNTGTWTLDAGDYSLITLNAPLTVNGATNLLYTPIYDGTDASLGSQSVNCMGCGFTSEASGMTGAQGLGTLTSANMTIASPVSGAVLTRNRSANVVGFGGDSGSACLLNGAITGVQSTCSCASFIDLNGNGKQDLWRECSNASSCNSSAPSNFKTFVEDAIFAPLQVSFDSLPALPPGTTAVASVTTTRSSFSMTVLGSVVIPRVAPRSGAVTVVVNQEPPRTMCPQVRVNSPLSGNAVASGRCLGDGLVSVLL